MLPMHFLVLSLFVIHFFFLPCPGKAVLHKWPLLVASFIFLPNSSLNVKIIKNTFFYFLPPPNLLIPGSQCVCLHLDQHVVCLSMLWWFSHSSRSDKYADKCFSFFSTKICSGYSLEASHQTKSTH